MLSTVLCTEMRSVYKTYEIFYFMGTYSPIGKAKKKNEMI